MRWRLTRGIKRLLWRAEKARKVRVESRLIVCVGFDMQRMIEMAVAARRYARDDLGMLKQKAFQRRGVLRRFGSASGWLERGEQIAVLSVAEAVRGAPILDIGVGGGRTAPLMREISTDYRGIDFAPKMIATARARFPTLDFRKMDARHLEFGDGSFALATFS